MSASNYDNDIKQNKEIIKGLNNKYSGEIEACPTWFVDIFRDCYEEHIRSGIPLPTLLYMALLKRKSEC